MRWSQARTVFELIGELRDRGDEPATWRTHLGHELRRLVGARVVVGVECRLQPRLFDTDILGLSHVGWENERERDAFCSPVEDPAEAAIQAWAGRSHTVARHELLPDRQWYRSEFAHHLERQAGLDQFAVSMEMLPERGVFSSLILYRSTGERPFSSSELELVDRVHRELAHLWRAPDPRLALPRRLRQTLSELLIGRSEKEIAAALRLSPHTVHQYVTMLYRRFDVRSRAELHARAGRVAQRRPLLTVEVS